MPETQSYRLPAPLRGGAGGGGSGGVLSGWAAARTPLPALPRKGGGFFRSHPDRIASFKRNGDGLGLIRRLFRRDGAAVLALGDDVGDFDVRVFEHEAFA